MIQLVHFEGFHAVCIWQDDHWHVQYRQEGTGSLLRNPPVHVARKVAKILHERELLWRTGKDQADDGHEVTGSVH